jgi:hypothetical protein
MKLTRTSPLTKTTVTRDLPVTEEQLADWKAGTLIQRAMPDLPAADREWLKTGFTEDDWQTLDTALTFLDTLVEEECE